MSRFFLVNWLIAFSFDNEVCGVLWKWELEIKLSRWFVWSWAWLIPLFGPDWLSLTQNLAFTPGTGVPPGAYHCLFSVMESLPGGCNEREGEDILQVCLTVTGAGIEKAHFFFFFLNLFIMKAAMMGGMEQDGPSWGRNSRWRRWRGSAEGGLGKRVTHSHTHTQWETNKPLAVLEHQLTGAACWSSQHP